MRMGTMLRSAIGADDSAHELMPLGRLPVRIVPLAAT